MQSIIIFCATFAVVFALGFQSLTVNRGLWRLAFLNSFLISAANLVILKYVPQATGTLDYLAYMCGGPIGIISSMYVFKRVFKSVNGSPAEGGK